MRASDKKHCTLAVAFLFFARIGFRITYSLVQFVKAIFGRENKIVWFALLLAVLMHVVAILVVTKWLTKWFDLDNKAVQFEIWSKDSTEREQKKSPVEQLEDYKPQEDLPDGEVVRAPLSKDKRRPENTRFLAEQDGRVEKETKAPNLPGRDNYTSRGQKGSGGLDPITIERNMQAALQSPDPAHGGEQSGEGEEGQGSTDKKGPPALGNVSLQPSMKAMSSAIAGSGLEYLDDVADGNVTALNTRGWEHASFFNRVKSQVELYWYPDVEYQKHDPYGNIYGQKDRITVILVVLRADGSLKQTYVMGPSGAPFLDEEASEAIQQAAPFPNVPPALMDKRDGLVKFTFHFIVQIGGQSIFRMRRYE